MQILALGLLLAVLILAGTILLYVRRWSAGRPAKVDWLAGLRRLPRAYLHDVHEVVSRESLAGGMHALTAGGLLASLALLLLMAWGGWRGILPGLLLLAGLACLIAGSLLVARRRYPQKPGRLSGGRFQVLPFLLLIFPLVAAPIAFAEMGLLPEGPNGVPPGQILTSLLLLALAAQIAGGPLKHVVAGALHLIVHPRPARFGAKLPVADLAPLDLAAPRLGAGAIGDFTWNRLVGFDACIQCGRCESVCPANAAGQPLNPKALIQDLVAALPRPPAERYQGSPHPPRIGESLGPPILRASDGRGVIEPETLWACTSCRACVYECPMMIEHVDAIVSMRRHQTLELGATPGKGAEALAELKAADNPGGRALASRLDWATDLALPRLAEVDERRRPALAGRRRLRAARPADLAQPGPPAAPGEGRFRGDRRGGARLRRYRPAPGRRGFVPGSRPAQHRAARQAPLPADPHRRSPCAALPEERISGLGRAL